MSTKTGICCVRVNPKPSDSRLTITVRSCHNRPVGGGREGGRERRREKEREKERERERESKHHVIVHS